MFINKEMLTLFFLKLTYVSKKKKWGKNWTYYMTWRQITYLCVRCRGYKEKNPGVNMSVVLWT